MSIFQDETPGFTDPAEIDDGQELEPIEESSLEQDRRSTGSFAEGQQRLARALDNLTELAIRREE